MTIYSLDHSLLRTLRTIAEPTARIGLFVVFFWFGLLKLLGLSPATELVHALYEQTIPFVNFDIFYAGFAALECLIGILFVIRGAERIVFPLLILHLLTTGLPLVYTPELAWQAVLVPTLAGQYIIKNIVLLAAAVGIVAHLQPLKERS